MERQDVFALVLIGSFNPKIFHPTWYVQNELLVREELEDVTDLICAEELSTFAYNGIQFQIERHRFGLTTQDESRVQLMRDLARSTFALLEHTPLTAVGLNRDMLVSVQDASVWHEIGHRLAPKTPWESVLNSPGMRIVAMQGQRDECNADRINIRVQPRGEVENGVLVAINQHYDLESEASIAERNATLLEILDSDWDTFVRYALSTGQELIPEGFDT